MTDVSIKNVTIRLLDDNTIQFELGTHKTRSEPFIPVVMAVNQFIEWVKSNKPDAILEMQGHPANQ